MRTEVVARANWACGTVSTDRHYSVNRTIVAPCYRSRLPMGHAVLVHHCCVSCSVAAFQARVPECVGRWPLWLMRMFAKSRPFRCPTFPWPVLGGLVEQGKAPQVERDDVWARYVFGGLFSVEQLPLAAVILELVSRDSSCWDSSGLPSLAWGARIGNRSRIVHLTSSCL